MKNNERSPYISIFKTSLILLTVIGAILFVLYASNHYVKRMSVDENILPSQVQQTPTKKGSFSLESTTGRTVFLPQDDITVSLFADSHGVNISGYDLIFASSISGAKITVKEVQSMAPGLDARVVDKSKGWINGSLNLDTMPEGIALHNTPLAECILKQEGGKKIDLEIDFSPGETRDSNMMQMTPPSDILSEVHGFTVYVGSKVTLKPNAVYALPNSDISIHLIKLTVPEGICNDCSTQAELEVKKGAQSQKVTLMLGGIQGKATDFVDIFGYRLETSDMTHDALVVYLAPLAESHEKQ